MLYSSVCSSLTSLLVFEDSVRDRIFRGDKLYVTAFFNLGGIRVSFWNINNVYIFV